MDEEGLIAVFEDDCRLTEETKSALSLIDSNYSLPPDSLSPSVGRICCAVQIIP